MSATAATSVVAVAANASELLLMNASTRGGASSYPRFNQRNLNAVIIYCFLFVIAAVGNLTVFVSLLRSRHRKSRISLMIRHLTIADLVVTFIMIPLEIGWRLTVEWLAGNFACKAFLFIRAFGLYLSSNVLVCVSLDRYFAVLHPLKVNDARRRGKLMLAWAWSISLVCAIPQSIVFHVASHPDHPQFFQCVTFGAFSSPGQEVVYNLFCVIAMYFIPLLVIVVAYTAIMCEISHKSRETTTQESQTGETPHGAANGRMCLRRSDISQIERARRRTLRMTITIVVVFVICWTPYVVITLWYTFDRRTAENVPEWLQDSLFMMAVSNSCMNPLVYGSYAFNFRHECCKCFLFKQRTTHHRTHHIPGAANNACKAGQGDGLIQRFLANFLSNKKHASSVTRSTAMLHTIGNARPHQQHFVGVPAKVDVQRPPSVRDLFLGAPPAGSPSYRLSYHSDPSPYRNGEHAAATHSHPASDVL